MDWVSQAVGRRSYGCDIVFEVMSIEDRDGVNFAWLVGRDVRLIADAPLDDLELMSERQLEEVDEQLRQKKKSLQPAESSGKREDEDARTFHLPGRVLHLDGDERYLKKCMKAYTELQVPHIGIHCAEKEMAECVKELLNQYQPQILVLTGHDAYLSGQGDKNDLSAYRHSTAFVKAVQEARRKMPNLDQLVIFAGACQSHFESLIHAGANFASSPLRVNIHALDPAYAAGRISYTPFKDSFSIRDLLPYTLASDEGIGGIETRGVLRTGMPYRAEIYTKTGNDT
ncbi:sporulation peptidase YabG [Jeotgalibacillus aurantiacus]|uniref:sporulation peptidase YabG n=1 Tax=Jeotgalibacillus aurantiacus TaxID=2763266 RepID=UPI001D0B41BF|nr:sporulation peptidase YabG [Jeotgalibacillus aurantiacus]